MKIVRDSDPGELKTTPGAEAAPRPGSREHRIASLLFGIAAAALLLAFLFTRGWNYGWMLLGLGIMGCVRAIWHLIRSRMLKP